MSVTSLDHAFRPHLPRPAPAMATNGRRIAELRAMIEGVDRWEGYARTAVRLDRPGLVDRLDTYARCAAAVLACFDEGDDPVVDVDVNVDWDRVTVEVVIDREPAFRWLLVRPNHQ